MDQLTERGTKTLNHEFEGKVFRIGDLYDVTCIGEMSYRFKSGNRSVKKLHFSNGEYSATAKIKKLIKTGQVKIIG